MMKPLAIVLLLTLSAAVWGQGKYDANWCFGDKAGIDFSNLSNPAPFISGCNNFQMTACISDSLGRLLFYMSPDTFPDLGASNYSLYDAHNNKMLNSDSLLSTYDIAGGTVILPFSKGAGIEYTLLHLAEFDSIGSAYRCKLFESKVAKTINGYQVTEKNKLLLDTPLEYRLAGVRHADGENWWVVVHQSNLQTLAAPTNRYYVFQVTKDTILGPTIEEVGSLHMAANSDAGQMCFSPSGNHLLCATGDQNEVEVSKFDRCNGQISEPNLITHISSDNGVLYGCEFSTSGDKIFMTESFYNGPNIGSNNLYQYRLDTTDIVASKKVIWTDINGINTPFVFGQLKLAPNDKIYLSVLSINNCCPYQQSDYNVNNQYLWVINNPDSDGTSCNFQPYGFYLGDSSRSYYSLPNMPNYNLGPLSTIWQTSAGRDTFICANQDSILKGVPLGGDSITGVTATWDTAPGITDVRQLYQVVYPTASRWYHVTFSDTTIVGSCQSREDSVYVEVRVCDGIGEQPTLDIRVYPNPASNQLTVETPNNASVDFQLYDFIGHVVLQQTLNGSKNVVDISALSQGLYLYKAGNAAGKLQVVR